MSSILTIFFIGLLGYYFFINGNGNTKAGDIVSTFKNFLPFGGEEIPTPTDTGDNTGNTNNPPPPGENQDFIKKLRKISAEPVSGAGTADVKAGTIVRYIEKATGHVYEVELFSPKKVRISNTTIPLSYDAIWLNKNNSFIARYLKEDDQTIDTYSMTIKNTSTSTENILTGTAFPGNITDVSTYGVNVFYLQKSSTGSLGFTSSFDGTKKKQVWDSPLKELNSQFVNDRTVTLNTKPVENISGYLYSVDTTSGATKKLIGSVPGLSSLSNDDLSKIVYLSQGNFSSINILNVKDKVSTGIFPVTFPEKCVWSKKDKSVLYCAVPKADIGNGSLSLWYKGIVSFSDDIWQYNTKDFTSKSLTDLKSESGEDVDVIKPILSENEQYLIFVNKKDNSLWSLDLTK